ncbi:MAG: hypothetical protein JJU02_06025 [Cryomorphaceae bacterium]|nr:hypothetical protein [Cryomorphaceae bacterium]
MEQEFDLFSHLPEDEKPKKVKVKKDQKNEIIIPTFKTSKVSSKMLNSFNKRLRAIADLQRKLDKKKLKLKEIEKRYNHELRKEHRGFCDAKTALIEVLDKRHDQKSFSESQKEVLSEMIIVECKTLMESYGIENSKMFEKHYFDKTEKALDEDDKDNIIFAMAMQYGLDITDEEVEALRKKPLLELVDYMKSKMEDDTDELEYDSNIDYEFDYDFSDVDETEKDEQRKKEESLLKSDITALYKRLSKQIHPDLEQDEEIRRDKEEMMKTLTAARKNNDLYHLLKMESMINAKNGLEEAPFDEDQLKRFNEILLEQKEDLMAENFQLERHSEYSFYYQNFYALHDKTITNNLKKYRERLKAEIEMTLGMVEDCSNVSKTKRLISGFKEANAMIDNILYGDDFEFR